MLLPCLCIWIVGAWDLLTGEENSMVGTVEWTARVPVILFTSWQYLYFISIPALLLIILSSLPVKYQRGVLWTGLSLLFLLPPLEIYNHHETIYFSPRWVGIVCTLSFIFIFSLKVLIKQCTSTVSTQLSGSHVASDCFFFHTSRRYGNENLLTSFSVYISFARYILAKSQKALR